MVIDRSSKWWKGESPADLEQYVKELCAEGYPIDRVGQAVCAKCKGTSFELEVGSEESCAKRKCSECQEERFIFDSEEWGVIAEPKEVSCVCGAKLFDVVVGFSPGIHGDLIWVTVGVRCRVCGVMGSPVDWKVDFPPTDQLLENV